MKKLKELFKPVGLAYMLSYFISIALLSTTPLGDSVILWIITCLATSFFISYHRDDNFKFWKKVLTKD